MDNATAEMNGFSCVVVIFVFDSLSMYCFWGSNLVFLCVFGYILLPIGILLFLMFFFDFYLTLSLLDD